MYNKSNSQFLFLFIISLFWAFGISAHAHTGNQPLNKPLTIPLSKSSDGLLTLEVDVQNKNSIPMLLDTAASISGILDETATNYKLENIADSWRVHGLSSAEQKHAVKFDGASIRGVPVEKPFVILDETSNIQNLNVKGLVGSDFLTSTERDYRYMVLDVANERLVFTNKLRPLGLRGKVQWSKLLHAENKFGLLMFKTRTSGVSTTTIIDTGLTFGVINKVLATKLENKKNVLGLRSYIDVNGEKRLSEHAQLDKITGANTVWNGPRVFINSPPALEVLGLANEPAMIMGLGYLQDQVLVIDRRHERLTITSSKHKTRYSG